MGKCCLHGQILCPVIIVSKGFYLTKPQRLIPSIHSIASAPSNMWTNSPLISLWCDDVGEVLISSSSETGDEFSRWDMISILVHDFDSLFSCLVSVEKVLSLICISLKTQLVSKDDLGFWDCWLSILLIHDGSWLRVRNQFWSLTEGKITIEWWAKRTPPFFPKSHAGLHDMAKLSI